MKNIFLLSIITINKGCKLGSFISITTVKAHYNKTDMGF